jgi:hypothetical protein
MFGPHINIMIDPWQTGKTPPLNYSLLLTQHPDDNEPYAATRYPSPELRLLFFLLCWPTNKTQLINRGQCGEKKKKKTCEAQQVHPL